MITFKLDMVKCQPVCEPSLFVSIGNVVKWQRQQEIHTSRHIFFKHAELSKEIEYLG